MKEAIGEVWKMSCQVTLNLIEMGIKAVLNPTSPWTIRSFVGTKRKYTFVDDRSLMVDKENIDQEQRSIPQRLGRTSYIYHMRTTKP